MIHRKQMNICKSLNPNRNFMNAIPVFHSMYTLQELCRVFGLLASIRFACVFVCVFCQFLCTKAIISNTRNNWCNGIIFWRQTSIFIQRPYEMQFTHWQSSTQDYERTFFVCHIYPRLYGACWDDVSIQPT